MERNKPEPTVPGGAEVRFKQGEPTQITLTVRHLVDDWVSTDFTFDVSDGVASIRGIEPQGETYWVQQNETAREKAYRTVEEIPIVERVDRIND